MRFKGLQNALGAGQVLSIVMLVGVYPLLFIILEICGYSILPWNFSLVPDSITLYIQIKY